MSNTLLFTFIIIISYIIIILGDGMNKKGFTLIELLAVILILSIISLIAIAAVNNTVNHAKKETAKRNAETYFKAVESFVGLTLIDKEHEPVSDGKYTVTELSEKGVELQNTLPKSGKVTIKNNKVSRMDINVGDYDVLYEDEKYKVDEHHENLLEVEDVDFTFDGMKERQRVASG